MTCGNAPTVFKKGDPRPEGYMAWQDWALVQDKAGLRQSLCPTCHKWRFPQEDCFKTKCLEAAQ